MNVFKHTPVPTEADIPIADMYYPTLNEPVDPFYKTLKDRGIVLTDTQKDAVETRDGPNLMIAGAGSGKTTIIACRCAFLIQEYGISPKSILVFTYNEHMVKELRLKIKATTSLSDDEIEKINITTFHSFFLGLLRKQNIEHQMIKNNRQKHHIMRQVLSGLNIVDPYYSTHMLIEYLMRQKQNMVRVKHMPDRSPREREMKNILSQYEKWKNNQKLMDFEDILLYAFYLLEKRKDILEGLQRRYQYIMVDEAQDMSNAAYQLLKKLALPQNNLFLVADIEQSIYQFAGGNKDILYMFEDDFEDSFLFTMNINFRSTNTIIGLANALMQSHAPHRFKRFLKVIRDSSHLPYYVRPENTEQEAVTILHFIKKKVQEHNRAYDDFAILFPSLSYARSIIEISILNDIPINFYKERNMIDYFYRHYTIKPIMAMLYLVVDPQDLTQAREIIPTLYINKNKGMAFIEDQLEVKNCHFPLDMLLNFPGLQSWQKTDIKEKIELIKGLGTIPPKVAIQTIRKSFYHKYLHHQFTDDMTHEYHDAMDFLDELEYAAGRFKTVSDFINYVEYLRSKGKDIEDRGEKISISTIRKAKGKEFRTVFVLGLCEGILPSKLSSTVDEIEEDKRLFYVAVTRAKDELYISSPYQVRGSEVTISQFLAQVYKPVKGEKLVEDEEVNKSDSKEDTFIFEEGEDSFSSFVRWDSITDVESSSEKFILPPN